MRHWRDVSTSEAVRHRSYGIHESAGVLLASLVLEPLALVPACFTAVLGSYALSGSAAVYITAGEVLLAAMAWACAYLLSTKQPSFISVFRLRTVLVVAWSAALWAVLPGALFGPDAARTAGVIFVFFVSLRLVMSVAWTPYTFVSARLNVTLRHRVLL